MDGSSHEGTPVHITEAPRVRQGSDVILLQGELTGFADEQAEAERLKKASSPSPIQHNRTATLQLPIHGPIYQPDSVSKTLSLDRRRSAVVTPNQSPGTSRSGSEESLTDSFHRGEFRGSFTLRPRRKQNATQEGTSSSPQPNAVSSAESEEEPETPPPAPAIQVIPEEADLPPPLVIDPQAEFALNASTGPKRVSINANRPIAVTATLPRNDNEVRNEDEGSVGDEVIERGGDYRGSYHLRRRTDIEDGDLETTPPLDQNLKPRAKRAVREALKILGKKEEYQKESALSKICDFSRCCPCLEHPPTPPSIKFASAAGIKMMPNFFFPAMPKFLEDLWVTIELLVTIFEFIFLCATFEASPLNIFVLVLTIIAFLLALFDGFLYFIQTGSCAAGIRSIRKRLSGRKTQDEDEEEEEEENEKRRTFFQFLSQKQKKFLKNWFEVSRTIISEFLLYPLAVSDFIELIESQTYQGGDSATRINFGLFNIGLFYLILSVYFMRSFMALSSVLNVKRLPKNTQNNYTTIVAKFCIHLLGQVCVHAIILIMVGAKVNSEVVACNGTKIDPAGEAEFQVSGFLWYTIVSGEFLPFFGIIMFFLVNYAQLKQFSVAFYVDMMSTVVSEGFADLVFKGEGVKTSKEKAKKVLEKSNLIETKEELAKYRKSFTLKKRLLYRFTHPHVVLGTLAYFSVMIAFLVCHVFTVNPCSGDIEFLLFKDNGVTATFFIGLVVILVANYQTMVLALCMLLLIVLVAGFVVLLPFIAIVVTPIICIAAGLYFTNRKRKEFHILHVEAE